MDEREQAVTTHYGQRNLGATILAALGRMGKDVNALVPEDLAPIDHFHIRGRAATEELSAVCGVESAHHVLDVGCGLGGAARHLALQHGCRVTGVDLTPAYVEVARMLTGRLGLQSQVDFQVGNALALPFDDAAFDRVWSEHAQMNIADKAGLYGEIRRVLKPGGRLAFHDILQGPGGEPHFPAPWARDASANALIGPQELRTLLQSLGFDVKRWEDKTAVGLTWFRQRVAALREHGPQPLGFHTLIGSIAMQTQENNLRNLEEGRIVLFQAVLERVR